MEVGSSKYSIPSHLEGTATDAVHLARYSNAAVINKLMVIDKLKSIDTVSIDNNSKLVS